MAYSAFLPQKRATLLSECGPIPTVDSPEGRVASVAVIIACDLLYW
jgi:hypothetical protein